MAGSAAASLLVLATLGSTAGAVAYLAVFGVGTILGMTLSTAAMAYPVSLALGFGRARRALAVCAGWARSCSASRTVSLRSPNGSGTS
jgi:high-affinity nickel-transport protein